MPGLADVYGRGRTGKREGRENCDEDVNYSIKNIFETRSECIVQASLELEVLLPGSPKCWDHGLTSSCQSALCPLCVKI